MRRRDSSILIGSILIAVVLCGVVVLAFLVFRPRTQAQLIPTAELLVIPAPTMTPTPKVPVIMPTETIPPDENGITKGLFVQITGTDGEGLRLRTGPGIDQEPRFLGMDAEVFRVMDGPKRSDGFTWWFLVAPYDDTRSGWAASDYLTVVEQPTPEPTKTDTEG